MHLYTPLLLIINVLHTTTRHVYIPIVMSQSCMCLNIMRLHVYLKDDSHACTLHMDKRLHGRAGTPCLWLLLLKQYCDTVLFCV